ncbi:TetR/AcrR family transcriptional regulator [Streptomyces sp. SCL15-6]|uniref:TetR/AcrR family transcriptional regulator n=1 Tax=Streptomyces sp. SCL15-6 TaxID=2967222 RepID=UPI0029677930|nr:TetR family transcriptional regulator [Streptomyces sp. SCL15-6]
MARMAMKDRREALIAAAIRVMVRDGVTRTTTRAVVNEAGMPLGVFHYCFNAREELLQEVITRMTDASAAAAREAFAEAGDLASGISKSLQAFWDGVQKEPGEHLLTYELTNYALRQAGMEDLARRQYAHYLRVHEELLTEVAERNAIQWTVPLPALARYLNSVLDGLTLCWLVDRDDEHTREVLRLTGEHLTSLAQPVSE